MDLSISFENIREINKDRKKLKKIRSEGCLIIADTISICHPKIAQTFHSSMLDAYPSTFIVSLAPNYSLLEAVREIRTTLQFSISEMEFIKRRLDEELDADVYGVSEEVIESARLKRWLKHVIESTIKSKFMTSNEISQETKKDKGILDFMKY